MCQNKLLGVVGGVLGRYTLLIFQKLFTGKSVFLINQFTFWNFSHVDTIKCIFAVFVFVFAFVMNLYRERAPTRRLCSANSCPEATRSNWNSGCYVMILTELFVHICIKSNKISLESLWFWLYFLYLYFNQAKSLWIRVWSMCCICNELADTFLV